MTRPKYLKQGDTVAIVATAGVIKNKNSIYQAKSLLESWGLHLIITDRVFDNYHSFSSTDENRLEDLQKVLNNPNIKAIWCARGGYGTVRIVDDLDFTGFIKNPKWIVGYSDITVLHSHLHNLNFETLHAMMPVNMEFLEASRVLSVETLKNALFGKTLEYTIPSSKFNRVGGVNGKLVGGNLTILENLLGTNSSINTDGKILFIEDIDEYKYHIDRMLMALKRNGYFEKCVGLIVGGISNIKKNKPDFGKSIETLILEIVKEFNFPVVFDFPAGHDPENIALYLGREAKLSVGKKHTNIKFIE